MAAYPFTHLSACSGADGIGLGLKILFDDRIKTVAYIEREAYAAANLVARMADKTMDDAPIWDDISTFAGWPWRGRVDLFSAGFPCQPWSCAGQQKGTSDARWLWPELARCIGEMEPPIVLLENVPGLISGGGLEHVLTDLAALGYDAQWGNFSAAEMGASHRRERIIILAYPAPEHGADEARETHELGRFGQHVAYPSGGSQPRENGRNGREIARRSDATMADASGGGLGEFRESSERNGQFDRAFEIMAYAARQRSRETRPVRRGQPEERTSWNRGDVGNSELLGNERNAPTGWKAERRTKHGSGGIFPPGPGELERWREILEISTRLEPAVCRVADELAYRVDRLRLCGNGCVPLVIAVAFAVLADRAINQIEAEVTR